MSPDPAPSRARLSRLVWTLVAVVLAVGLLLLLGREPEPAAPDAAKAPAPAAPEALAVPPAPEPAREERPDPAARLRITGRVVDAAGEPVPGIEIDARQIGGHAAGFELARSDANGRFELAGLEAGRYRVTSRATSFHPPRTLIAEAGASGLELVLDASFPVRVHGRVTDGRDEPLAGARVEPVGHPKARTTSDARGRYEVRLDARAASTYLALVFEADDHRSHHARIRLADYTHGGLERNVRLAAAEGFTVTGRARTPRGDPLDGVTVYLASAGLRERAYGVTDADGRFRLAGVAESDDWRITVGPTERFAATSLGPFPLAEGADPIEVTLTPLETGSLSGRMVGPEGDPLPGVRLLAVSNANRSFAIPVVADASGRFELDDVPAGPLQFETRAIPSHQVSGASVEVGTRTELELVLDVGDHELAGSVVNAAGRPIPGADLRLSWDGGSGPMASRSFRRTASDADGRFRFPRLGGGSHRLEVRVQGRKTKRETYEVGLLAGEIEIRLED